MSRKINIRGLRVVVAVAMVEAGMKKMMSIGRSRVVVATAEEGMRMKMIIGRNLVLVDMEVEEDMKMTTARSQLVVMAEGGMRKMMSTRSPVVVDMVMGLPVVDMEEGTKRKTTRRSLVGTQGDAMRKRRGTRRLVAIVEGSMARRKKTRRRSMARMSQRVAVLEIT